MREHEPIVSIASSQRGWAAELLRFLADHGGARLRGTVLTSTDALEQDYEVLIIDDIASYLSPRLIDRIRRDQRRVIGVYDPELGDAARERLIEMGVDATMEADAGPDEFLELVSSLSLGDRPVVSEVAPTPSVVPTTRRISAVVGDDIASDVALCLASHFARKKHAAVLLDGDTVTPSVAQRLGMSLVPNLLTALDSLVQLRGSISDSLVAGPDGMTLLHGLPEASEWETIRATDVADLVDQLAGSFDEVVIKISPQIEDLSQFGGRAGRFEVARTVMRLAGDVGYVAEPSPLGLSRALSWVAAARQLTDARIHVLFADAPSSLFQRGELAEELTRSFVPSSITWLPPDPRRVRAAWNGVPVPSGPFSKSVSGLGEAMLVDARVGAA